MSINLYNLFIIILIFVDYAKNISAFIGYFAVLKAQYLKVIIYSEAFLPRFRIILHLFYKSNEEDVIVMDMLNTLKGSYFSEILPQGWDIAKIKSCVSNAPESVFARQSFWHEGFSPVKCTNLEEFGAYMGHEIAMQIKLTKEEGRKLILILPVGPMGMYKWAVYFLKEWNVDCKHVYGFNMDEWADAEGNTLPAADPAASGTITVTLPQYDSVGIYEYTLIEKAGTTAGVAYYGNAIRLVVTVINGDDGKLRVAAIHTESEGADKSDTFENTYSAGTLKISKTVTGNMGDKNKYFEFTVLLSGRSGMTYPETFAVSGGSYAQNPTTIKLSEETTFMLKHGDTISIANLPYDVDYMVIETAADGYTTTSTNETGRISA